MASIFGVNPIIRFGGSLLTSLGTEQQIGAYKAAGAASMAAAKYNAQLEKVDSERRQIQLGRQVSSVLSTQRAQAGASGLEVQSKSFLVLMNESLSTFERAIVDERNVAAQRQEAILFEGRAAEAEARNRARAARVSQIGNIFGTLLGGF